jgi:hypothetical protein
LAAPASLMSLQSWRWGAALTRAFVALPRCRVGETC